MKIALVGYGKMGMAIEELAKASGDEIVAIINNDKELKELKKIKPDVAIEFTNPNNALQNIIFCIENDIPVVSGTTGWLEKYEDAVAICKKNNGAFFYASNFSLGVNLFLNFNEMIAKVMSKYSNYSVEIEETHHLKKLDSPSGTAISLAERINKGYPNLIGWGLNTSENNKINIIAHRKEDVPGTHLVKYSSEIDEIELKHTAKGRKGFAQGALLAAKWLHRKKGVFGMNDMLNLE